MQLRGWPWNTHSAEALRVARRERYGFAGRSQGRMAAPATDLPGEANPQHYKLKRRSGQLPHHPSTPPAPPGQGQGQAQGYDQEQSQDGGPSWSQGKKSRAKARIEPECERERRIAYENRTRIRKWSTLCTSRSRLGNLNDLLTLPPPQSPPISWSQGHKQGPGQNHARCESGAHCAALGLESGFFLSFQFIVEPFAQYAQK